ncbi:hypothetical protein K493DRAFT_94234 [Basidiobolus meristosporus CBS 931.73]|uniref:Uncharacterized protein n=1 Tax=Basidiobolus meristosporus CBS 931.73 TaxID=1314790 RepID=A0A1Y1ZBQ0_9FUNG|nr:hypothetical protein K493DRAFT_94234 [Basidiobolus meristosporus CBS 931.73]|eukprot:ORY07616.1 hypothetical protein K493DRAFT_94234 [Basidiobolus meristosporus CBS 931.73]
MTDVETHGMLPNLTNPPEDWFASKNPNMEQFFAEAFKCPPNEYSQRPETTYSTPSKMPSSAAPSGRSEETFTPLVRVPTAEFYSKDELKVFKKGKRSSLLSQSSQTSSIKSTCQHSSMQTTDSKDYSVAAHITSKVIFYCPLFISENLPQACTVERPNIILRRIV